MSSLAESIHNLRYSILHGCNTPVEVHFDRHRIRKFDAEDAEAIARLIWTGHVQYGLAAVFHVNGDPAAHSTTRYSPLVLVMERRCRECGCTDYDCRQCIERTGSPCCWVEADLCSACEDATAGVS